ncbi:MAG: hypothetical protein HC883_04670 [Bdellovibrionaceae bacterium]|nr:hypothetical protein [Pseudobdellovibrionaceae bacterium]
MLLRDQILGVENPWAKLYDPSRLYARSFGAYLREAAQSSVPYGDWFTTGDVTNPQQIEAGEGAVIREGLSKVAVYKDDMNRLHCFSAVCTHLGGMVRWNTAEKLGTAPAMARASIALAKS